MNSPQPHDALGPIRSLFADDPDMVDLVQMFVEEMTERIAALEAAAKAVDRQSLKTLAHQLKGAAGGYGFPALGEVAALVEAAATTSEGDLSQLTQRVEQLISICRRAKA
jgi:HPt (histidine-containing phosphotransfer) domain-containing protein